MIVSIGRNTARPLVAATLLAATCIMLADMSSANTELVQLPALFNFTAFQQHFGKAYSSRLEAVSRKVYYLANAFQVYVAGLAYRHRRLSHYLALNHMSDWSPREREMMINKRLAGDDSSKTTDGDLLPVTTQDADNPEVLADELARSIQEKLAENHIEHELDESDNRERDDETEPRAKRARRQKRDVQKRRLHGFRKLSLDMLVKDNKPHPESPKVLAKLAPEPKSNNPLLNPLAIMRRPKSLIDQQEELKWLKLKEDKLDKGVDEQRKSTSETQQPGRLERLKNYLSYQVASFFYLTDSQEDFEEAVEANLPDEMFQDLNDSGCLFQPRYQDECGSCYAFAAIALAEFLFCKKTGHLYAFSEQYMIDCGNNQVEGMTGCDGAYDEAPPKFVHNFGLELRLRYPYAAKDQTCPYPDGTDLKTTGYIRMPLKTVLQVKVRSWSRILKHSPIIMALATSEDFHLYSGGVDSGLGCKRRGDHMMLVVGEGREDGKEFWLIRNSHGTSWGADGHYKLAKSAPKRCIEFQRGFVWSTENGVDYELEPALNGANPQTQKDIAAYEASKKKRERT